MASRDTTKFIRSNRGGKVSQAFIYAHDLDDLRRRVTALTAERDTAQRRARDLQLLLLEREATIESLGREVDELREAQAKEQVAA